MFPPIRLEDSDGASGHRCSLRTRFQHRSSKVIVTLGGQASLLSPNLISGQREKWNPFLFSFFVPSYPGISCLVCVWFDVPLTRWLHCLRSWDKSMVSLQSLIISFPCFPKRNICLTPTRAKVTSGKPDCWGHSPLTCSTDVTHSYKPWNSCIIHGHSSIVFISTGEMESGKCCKIKWDEKIQFARTKQSKTEVLKNKVNKRKMTRVRSI